MPAVLGSEAAGIGLKAMKQVPGQFSLESEGALGFSLEGCWDRWQQEEPGTGWQENSSPMKPRSPEQRHRFMVLPPMHATIVKMSKSTARWSN